MKRNKGTTMIALIVIIIVLLLLAGITIANLNGENGIFTKVKQSKEKYSISEAKETLELISKQWCSLSDLIKLTGLGKNSASKLKSEIRVDLVNKGYQLPTKLLPMNEVVNYLKININYLQKMSKEITN